ncbi:SRPBCC family protein [Halosimplex litoreum]|uniref:SRPBCC family protein n=1 Tax=Halosimplex litoreum TaxID=1198301 RepID=A0A7T3KV37_9EURY|nr:SRPBCC family protein [Halosimplex litoreum]QPV62739.1 SRPBCC family protein [Halosimplex litoreum]
MASLPQIERTPDGRRLVVDRVVAADADAVWTVLTDTEQWPEWGPSVSAVRSRDRYIEPGSRGEVQVAGGPWIPFEVETCGDYRWTWRVAEIPATGHAVTPLGDDRSRAAFEIPLLAGGYAIVCHRALDRIATIAESDELSTG